jgi:uncharacterized protein (DUF362 family)/Pyruvate/2-oxoacid:ferredoxin oxidoreductase delta subunit
MENSVVSIVRTPVDYSAVDEAVRAAVELCGGNDVISRFNERTKVLIKPNLLNLGNGESGNTTDYRVVETLIKLVQPQKSGITVGDASGLRWKGATQQVLEETGMAGICRENGAEAVNFDQLEPLKVPIPEGRVLSEAFLAPPAVQSDAIINVPKIKTHILTKTTGGVKNLFGCVLGGTKSAYHALGGNSVRFASLLADLYSVMKPELTVMDAVIGISGAWRPQDRIFPGLIIAGTDAVAVDAVAARILGFDPLKVPLLAEAQSRGLGVASLDRIKIVGEPLAGPVKENEGKARKYYGPSFTNALGGFLYYKKESPELIAAECTGCGHCPEACPVGAVTIVDGRPEFDLDKCIRCYCCAELCPQRAIRVTRGRLANLFMKR